MKDILLEENDKGSHVYSLSQKFRPTLKYQNEFGRRYRWNNVIANTQNVFKKK